MKAAIAIFALLASSLALAGVRGGCRIVAPDPPCLEHECSNDSSTNPIYGDELMRWSRPKDFDPDGDGTVDEVDRFEVGLDTGGGFIELCGVVRTCRVSPYQIEGCFPREGETYLLAVRACAAEGKGCGSWGTARVEFVGGVYVCFGSRPDGTACEEPCYDGAPKRISKLPGC